MMLVKANKDSEAGVLPSGKLLAAMAKYDEELVKAGVMLDGSGLQPSAKGARVSFAGGKPKVVDGPFSETKELIAGYWLIQVRSKDEAVEWAKRVPFGVDAKPGQEGEIEIRQLFELEDFGQREAVEHRRKVGKALAKKEQA